jgi:hypothetical protein
VSEILKPTGFDCPEDLKGVSFNEAVSGGDEKPEQEKSVTITENGDSTVTPDEGKTLKQVNITTAVPVPSIEETKEVTVDVSTYTGPIEITPSAGEDGVAKIVLTLTNIPQGE